MFAALLDRIKHAATALPGLRRYRRQSIVRRFTRHSCNVNAKLTLADRDLTLRGRILDISQGGTLFRPPSTYLLDRRSEAVILNVHENLVSGLLVTTSPRGYHIRFSDVVDETAVDLMRVPARVDADTETAEQEPLEESNQATDGDLETPQSSDASQSPEGTEPSEAFEPVEAGADNPDIATRAT